MNTIPPVTNSQEFTRMVALNKLQQRVKGGGSNFYWIAALSIINSIIALFGGGITFVIGLGITQIIDGFASAFAYEIPNAAIVIKGIGLLLNLLIAGLFALFGVFAIKGQRWAFITGMILYGLDAILVLVFKDFLGFGFHLFFLWLLCSGLQALRQLQATLPPTVPDPAFPKDIRMD